MGAKLSCVSSAASGVFVNCNYVDLNNRLRRLDAICCGFLPVNISTRGLAIDQIIIYIERTSKSFTLWDSKVP